MNRQDTPEIGGIRCSAPLFNKASLDDLQAIVDALSSASHHYADDSGGEWGAGRKALNAACQKANDLGLCVRAMQVVYKDKPQLVSEDQFLDGVLNITRAPAQVKPLVWENFDAWTWWAKSPFSIYRVNERDGRWSCTIAARGYTIQHPLDAERYNTEEAAKAAAQTGYERRIREALL